MYELNTIIRINAVCRNFILQQDGARCHTSTYSLGYIRTRVPELLEPEFWPPHSPDLNPLDYCLWGYIESAIHKHRHVTDFEELKQEIKKAWKAIPQEVVNKSILVFRKRLRMCIEANGGHIEQFL